VGTVRSGEVVKPFPFVEFGLEIDVTFVAEKCKRCFEPTYAA